MPILKRGGGESRGQGGIIIHVDEVGEERATGFVVPKGQPAPIPPPLPPSPPGDGQSAPPRSAAAPAAAVAVTSAPRADDPHARCAKTHHIKFFPISNRKQVVFLVFRVIIV